MTVSVRKRHVVAALLCVVTAFGAIAAVAVSLSDGDLRGRGADGSADVRLGGREFGITGNAVRALAPGRYARIKVRFTNRRAAPLRVTQLKVRVRAVTAPNADRLHPCTRRDFAVIQVRPRFTVTVPARSSKTLRRLHVPRNTWPRVGMVNSLRNQDGCKGAAITLSFFGSGSLKR